MTNLPRLVRELTPAWWTAALRPKHPDVECTVLEVVDVQWGTNSKVLMRAEYAPGSGTDLPEHLCVKGTFAEDEHSLSTINAQAMETEARFFLELAPQLDVPLPRVWHAAVDESGQGIVVLDDLNRQDVTFGHLRRPLTPDQVSSGLSALARLHGSSWGRTFPEVTWLTAGFAPIRSAAELMFTREYWDQHFTAEYPFVVPDAIADPDRILRGFRALWALDDAAPHCLTHGDAHLGNVFVEGGSQVRLIDWASPNFGPWAYDVSYFVGTSLSIDDRRQHERALLRDYLEVLAAHGGPVVDADQAWLDYRRHALHGLVWMTIPAQMHPVENVVAISERVAAAAIDHDALGVLRA